MTGFDDFRTSLPGADGENPFRVVVRKSEPVASPEPAFQPDNDEISLNEIEAAYLRALETAEMAESLVYEELAEKFPETLTSEEQPVPAFENTHFEAEHSLFQPTSPPTFDDTSLNAAVDSSQMPVEERSTEAFAEDATPNYEILPEPGREILSRAEEPEVSAEQVVEAMLFVGGAPLPVKKFLDVLGGAHTPEQVESMLEALNRHYIAQKRPYDIRMIEGGYQLQLNSAFEPVRGRAYGQGPKEVKLAQDALEMLAFIAYQQPVTKESLAETGKINPQGLVRQLVRRELVSIDRSDAEAGEQYRTTHRFLELFGLASLDDLPQAGTFNFK